MEIISLNKHNFAQPDEQSIRAFFDIKTRQNPTIERFVLNPFKMEASKKAYGSYDVGPLKLSRFAMTPRGADKQTFNYVMERLDTAQIYQDGIQIGVRHEEDTVWVNVDRLRTESTNRRDHLKESKVPITRFTYKDQSVPDILPINLSHNYATQTEPNAEMYRQAKSMHKNNEVFSRDFSRGLADKLGILNIKETTEDMFKTDSGILNVQVVPGINVSYSKVVDNLLEGLTVDNLAGEGYTLKHGSFVPVNELRAYCTRNKKTHTDWKDPSVSVEYIPLK